MYKLINICLAIGLLATVTSCGNNNSASTTTNDSTVATDTMGSMPAPSNNAVDMSKTQVDSLRNTTDIKADTPAIKK